MKKLLMSVILFSGMVHSATFEPIMDKLLDCPMELEGMVAEKGKTRVFFGTARVNCPALTMRLHVVCSEASSKKGGRACIQDDSWFVTGPGEKKEVRANSKNGNGGSTNE